LLPALGIEKMSVEALRALCRHGWRETKLA
jgi:hypothetical protein